MAKYIPRKPQPRPVPCRPYSADQPRRPATAPRRPAAVPAAAQAAPAPTLRQRYQFLDEPDCPVELHALVGHRISQYNLYSKLYAQLPDCPTLESLSTTCGQLLDAYLDNRQCTAELDYYQRHRRVLGRHPLMRQFRQLSDLRSKTTRQLFEERRRTEDNIWRAESEIKKGNKPHLDHQRQARIKAYQLKLQEINRLLGE